MIFGNISITYASFLPLHRLVIVQASTYVYSPKGGNIMPREARLVVRSELTDAHACRTLGSFITSQLKVGLVGLFGELTSIYRGVEEPVASPAWRERVVGPIDDIDRDDPIHPQSCVLQRRVP